MTSLREGQKIEVHVLQAAVVVALSQVDSYILHGYPKWRPLSCSGSLDIRIQNIQSEDEITVLVTSPHWLHHQGVRVRLFRFCNISPKVWRAGDKIILWDCSEQISFKVVSTALWPHCILEEIGASDLSQSSWMNE